MSLDEKFTFLKNALAEMDSIIVAYSGGVDSTLLLKVAVETLGRRALGITSTSETISRRELAAAKDLAVKMKAAHELIYTGELSDNSFTANPVNRCYYCKKELFSKLLVIAQERGYRFVADGSNSDDLSDYRPGLIAGRELGVRSPLQEAGLTKDDIRQLSKILGLPTWKKPAKACLSSRFPYGNMITLPKIKQVELGEELLEDLGFSQARLRHHGDLARIEIPVEEFSRLTDAGAAALVSAKLKELGFIYITLDLTGYRSGSMNEAVDTGDQVG